MANAYTYVTEVGGLDTERSYLYEGEVDVCRYMADSQGGGVRCRYNPLRVGAREAGYMAVRVGDELALQEAVATQVAEVWWWRWWRCHGNREGRRGDDDKGRVSRARVARL